MGQTSYLKSKSGLVDRKYFQHELEDKPKISD